MAHYKVRWTIDAEGVSNPEEAARYVWERYFHREYPPEPDSCCVFDVVLQSEYARYGNDLSRWLVVDLNEPEGERTSTPTQAPRLEGDALVGKLVRLAGLGEQVQAVAMAAHADRDALHAFAQMVAGYQTTEEIEGERDGSEWEPRTTLDEIIVGARQALAGKLEVSAPVDGGPSPAAMRTMLEDCARWLEEAPLEELEAVEQAIGMAPMRGIRELLKSGQATPDEVLAVLRDARDELASAADRYDSMTDDIEDWSTEADTAKAVVKRIDALLAQVPTLPPSQPATIRLDIWRGVVNEAVGLPPGITLEVHDIDNNLEDAKPCEHHDERCVVHEFTGK